MGLAQHLIKWAGGAVSHTPQPNRPLVSASEEAYWLRDLFYEIPLWEKLIPPILIHCDSLQLMELKLLLHR